MGTQPFSIIVILTIAFLMFVVGMPIIAKLSGAELPSFLNLSLDIQTKQKTQTEFDFGMWGAVIKNDITRDGQPQTASHAACAISKFTYDDFTGKGDELHGDNIPLSRLRLINWFGLGFDWNAQQQRPYVLQDLNQEQQAKLAGEGCSIECAPALDEKCVTKYFSQLKVGGKPFCGEFTKFFSGKLDTLKFGNNRCKSLGDETWGVDQKKNPLAEEKCEDLCPGRNRVVDWTADESLSIYDISDDLKPGSFPPANTSLQPDYVFVLYWNTEEEAYKYSLAKMPRNGVDQPLKAVDLAKSISRYLNDYKRAEPGGFKIPELATVSALGYVVKEEYGFADFLSRLENGIGGEISAEQCSSLQECLFMTSDSIAPYRKVQFTTMQIDFDGGVDLHEDWVYDIDLDLDGNFQPSEFLGESKEFFKQAKVFTNIQDDETLDRESLYFILVRNWEMKENEVTNRNAKGIGLYCINPKTKAVRQSDNCKPGEVWRTYINTYRGFLDRSVIIYRQPLFGFDECGNGIPEDDACGTKEQVLDLGQGYKNANLLLRFVPTATGKIIIENSTDSISWTKAEEKDVSQVKTTDDDDVTKSEFVKIDSDFRYIKIKSDAPLKYSSAKIVDRYDLGFDYCGNGLPVNDACEGSEHVLDLQQTYANREVEVVWQSESGFANLEYSIDGEKWNPKVSMSFPVAGLRSTKVLIPDKFRFIKLSGENSLELKYSEVVVL